MGYDPKARVGVVVLSNLSTAAGPDDIGRHLLNASYPLMKAEPLVEHKEITLDTKILDRYVGTYQMDPSVLVTVSREDNRLYTQLTRQPKVEAFPESERKFFLKVVDAQFSFDVDAQGTATQLTIHQNGREIVAKRLNEEETRKAVESVGAHQAEIAKRVKEQKPAEGTEAALRRSIGELQAGEPKYELMSAPLADLMRQQLPQLKTMIANWGMLQSVTFKSVNPGGADVYAVVFEHGSTMWTIVLGPDGKTIGLGVRPQ
jgi:hypothetical protein